MTIYQFTTLENFESEVSKVSKYTDEIIIRTDSLNYETVKEQIMDSCYNIEDHDKQNNLLIVKWVLLDARPLRKINNINE